MSNEINSGTGSRPPAPDPQADTGSRPPAPDPQADTGPRSPAPDPQADTGSRPPAPDPQADTGPRSPAPDPQADTGPRVPAPDPQADTGPRVPAPDPYSGPGPGPQAQRKRFVVGIDLGTTNCAAAYVDLQAAERKIVPLHVPQLVAEGTVAERPSLPSFLYIAGEHDVAPGSLALPWDPDRTYAVGELARTQGARVVGRLVTSAKSWLCHGGVDREAKILPWGAPDDVPKLSPVEASARYLQHLREAWEQQFPDAPLQAQDVILTVPASFDEVARELTVEAANRAGLEHAVLLEEPQAAFYSWIHAHQDDWQERLRDVRLALVVDVGGGTSDFSLIAVRDDNGLVGLERLAVGEHILLGGDNIDVALAHRLESRLGEKLDSQRWHTLTTACRAAKETLLGPNPPEEVSVQLVGRGRSVVGGVRSATLTRQEVEELAVDGFFPLRSADELPRRAVRSGLQEWGLPFANEAEVSRHLAAFLDHHARQDGERVWPDAILFNGGALKPRRIRDRLCALLTEWSGGAAPLLLENTDLELGVATGAAYYGLVRRGLGVRIGGGSPRAYYLGLAGNGDGGEEINALCLVQRGMHEGDEIEMTTPEFEVLANHPVSFPLFTSSTRLGDRAGQVLAVDRDTVTELPPIRTVLRFGKKLAATKLPVHVIAKLTEIGTLEVWCRSLKTDHRWRLQFALRDQLPEADGADEQKAREVVELEIGEDRIAAAAAELRAVFPPGGSDTDADPVTLTRRLEEHLGAGKDAWPLIVIRKLWDVLWEGQAASKRTPQHEARWLNLSGFLLRPGFGHVLDEWRIQQLWRLLAPGLRFPRAVQCRVEWWNMWKRVAGGLSRAQQMELYNQTAPFLVPRLKSKVKGSKSVVGPQEIREYWQLLASCERLPVASKVELGSLLVKPVAKGKATDAEIWAFGRIGARAPFSGPLNCVVPRETVSEWVEEMLRREWQKPESTAFAAIQLSRFVGDRERDLDESLRHRLAERLRTLPSGQRGARLVTELVPLESQERARILDESLPAGLRIAER